MSNEEFGKRAVRGFAWNHLYRIVDYAIYFLFTALVARTLGSIAVAPFFVYISLAFPIALIGSVGVDGVLLRFLARIKNDGQDVDPSDLTTLPLLQFLTRLFSFRVFITIILCALVFLVLVVLPFAFPSVVPSFGSLPSLAPYLILFLCGQAAIAFSTFALIGLLQVRKVFIASLISRLLLIGSAILLVVTGNLTVERAVIVHTVSVLINATLLLYSLWRAVEEEDAEPVDLHTHKQTAFGGVLRELAQFILKPTALKFFLLTPVMLYGITTWGSDILSTVLGRQPDILMMRIFFGEHSKEISNYQVATTILLMAEYVVVFGFSGGALVSVFSSLAHQDEQEQIGTEQKYPKLLRARKEVAAFLTVATLPICAYTFVFAKQLVLFVFGKEFLPSVPILQVGIIIMAINIAWFGGGVQVTSLVTVGKERLVFRNRLGWGIVNLVANFFLIRQYGAMGALYGTQLSNMAACGVEFIYANRLIGTSLDLKNSFGVVAISSSSAVFAYYIVSLFASSIDLFWQIASGGLIAISACLLCYYLFKVRSANRILEKLKHSILPTLRNGVTGV